MKNQKSLLMFVLGLFVAAMLLTCSSGETTEAPSKPATTDGKDNQLI